MIIKSLGNATTDPILKKKKKTVFGIAGINTDFMAFTAYGC